MNYPYTATAKVIAAAQLNHATIVYPGSVYNYGNAKAPIGEATLPKPCSRNGKLRVKLEAMMEDVPF